MHYFSHYYCIEDIFVTQEKAECKVNTRLQRMGFLDAGSETDHLEPGRKITLPLWYIKDLKVNNAYLFAVGSKTNAQFINWLELRGTHICISPLVEEHLKKRSRVDERASQSDGN